VALIDSAQRETTKPRMMRGFFIIPWLRYSNHRYARKLLEYFHSSRVFTRE